MLRGLFWQIMITLIEGAFSTELSLAIGWFLGGRRGRSDESGPTSVSKPI